MLTPDAAGASVLTPTAAAPAWQIAEDCAQWNQTCNTELLDGERLIALKAPFWFWKLESLLNGDLHDISDDTHRSVGVEYLRPLLRTHYIYVMAPLLGKKFLDATLVSERVIV